MSLKITSRLTHRFPGLIIHWASPEAKKKLRLGVQSHSIDIIDDQEHRMISLNRANAIYTLDMLNYFDYYFGSAEPITVRRGSVSFSCVDFSTPRYQHVDGFDDFPVMCPSLTEPFVTTQQYLDFAQLRDGGVAIDLGSYSGLTSIAFSKAVGMEGRVIALEPDPGNFAASKINIANHQRINGLSNISLLQAAASDRRGQLTFSAEGAMGSAEATVVGRFRGTVIDVECLTLSDVAEMHALDKIDFVKIDIEGAEEKVLSASEAFFRAYRPRVMIEPHLVNRVLSQDSVINILQRFGYRCESIEQHGVSLPLVRAWPV